MKELYEVFFGVEVLHPKAKDWDVGDIIRLEIEHSRDALVAKVKADGADPRHYLWTMYELPMNGSMSYRFRMTAVRRPQSEIDYIEGAGKHEATDEGYTGAVRAIREDDGGRAGITDRLPGDRQGAGRSGYC